jgi:hypothetical protein
MKYTSFTFRVAIAFIIISLPFISLALFSITQDHSFLLPSCMGFCAMLAITELDKRSDSRLLQWFSRPL